MIVEVLPCFDAFVWVVSMPLFLEKEPSLLSSEAHHAMMLGKPAITSLLMTAATYLVRRGSGEETRGLEAIVARP